MTYFIAAGSSITQARALMSKELVAASNIKSRENRHHVLQSVSWCATYLQSLKEVPSNGLLLLSGEPTEQYR